MNTSPNMYNKLIRNFLNEHGVPYEYNGFAGTAQI